LADVLLADVLFADVLLADVEASAESTLASALAVCSCGAVSVADESGSFGSTLSVMTNLSKKLGAEQPRLPRSVRQAAALVHAT
jgi:hypothetical protein